jgi:hypothetical protein
MALESSITTLNRLTEVRLSQFMLLWKKLSIAAAKIATLISGVETFSRAELHQLGDRKSERVLY